MVFDICYYIFTTCNFNRIELFSAYVVIFACWNDLNVIVTVLYLMYFLAYHASKKILFFLITKYARRIILFHHGGGSDPVLPCCFIMVFDHILEIRNKNILELFFTINFYGSVNSECDVFLTESNFEYFNNSRVLTVTKDNFVMFLVICNKYQELKCYLESLNRDDLLRVIDGTSK